MTKKRSAPVLALAMGLFAPGAGGEVRHDADVLVALGAGVAGTWETDELAAGETVFLQDVLAGLGVTELAAGQLRVTRTAGNGKM